MKSQVSGCYNFYLHQPGNSVGSPLNQMHWCPGNVHTKRQPATAGAGYWGKEDAVGPAHKF